MSQEEKFVLVWQDSSGRKAVLEGPTLEDVREQIEEKTGAARRG